MLYKVLQMNMKLKVMGLCLLLVSSLCLSVENTMSIDAEEWARPRSGEMIATMPAVRQAVTTWMRMKNADITIRYPGGETGIIWAQELRDWLVSLGVESNALILSVGSSAEDQLDLIINVR